jgi:hypothetical protein
VRSNGLSNPAPSLPTVRASGLCAGELDELVSRIAKLEATEPARAVALYEAFLAGCYGKIEEVDDSSGSFGQTGIHEVQLGGLHQAFAQVGRPGG